MTKKTFSYQEVFQKSLEYFKGDELAASVFAGKYALQDNGEYYELTPADMHRRIAKELARIESKYPNPMSEDEIFDYLSKWEIVPQGSPMSGIGNPFQMQSLSNCYVVENPYDAFSGILKTDQELAQIYKRRGGCGVDISSLRPRGSVTNNAAKTSDGIGVFMERFSNTTREVGMSGRRGANMQTISVHHPDIRTFIAIKKDKKKVTGSNISIRLSDEFLDAVKKGKKYQLRFPVEKDVKHSVEETVDAKEVWDSIVQHAWESAEPGLLFWDNILYESVPDCYAKFGFKTVSTNPCFAPGTLVHTKQGHFPIEQLVGKTVDIWNGTEWQSVDNFRVTATKQACVNVVLYDGTEIVCTPYHEFIDEHGNRVQAKDLAVGTKLKISSAWSTDHDNTHKITSGFNTVSEVKDAGTFENVYCCTVPGSHSFSLSCGIQVGQCSELPLSAGDSCRLTLLNLSAFVTDPYTEKAKFDYEKFAHLTQKGQRIMDDIVDLEIEVIEKILAKVESDPEPPEVKSVELRLWQNILTFCKRGRRTGLGITALGDTLAALGIKYGSEESVKVTSKIYKTLGVNSYKSSIYLAQERGAFECWNESLEKDNPFIKRIMGILDDETKAIYKKCGRRNIANLTTAPAGSVSILTQTTSGIEPVYLLSYKRRKKINPGDRESRVDFVDESGDSWQEYDVYHHGLSKWAEATQNSVNDVKKSPYWGATSEEIDWTARVEMQAAANKWVDHSISSTVNLPSTATVKDVEKVYMKAWESGCKGITVYRDGSRTGVLVKDSTGESPIKDTRAPKRPESLPCELYRATIKGKQHLIVVGLYYGRPYEIFAGLAENIEVGKKETKGKLVKTSKKTYDLVVGEETFKDISSLFDNPNYGAFTRTLSTALRHGVPVALLAEQLKKDKHSDFTSFSTIVARILTKNYVKDGTKSYEKRCQQCESDNLVYQEGCVTCMGCGYSKCG